MQSVQAPGTMVSRSSRQSNVELLRILAAFGVIFQHYSNPMIGGGIRLVAPGSLNQSLMTLFHVVMICAVNLFMLISGYFMRDSRKRDLLKPIELLSQFFVFELLFLCLKELPKGEALTFNTVVGYYTPHYWFVFVYIALYLISPYINAVWRQLKYRDKKILLALAMGLFSAYPIILDIISYFTGNPLRGTSTIGLEGSQAGYTIVNAVLMYLIGCFIRDWEDRRGEKRLKTWKIALLLILNIGILCFWTVVEKTMIVRETNLATPWRYLNPLVITEAILFFLLFRQIKMKNSRVINSLAAAVFPSYLIHVNLLPYCNIRWGVQGSPLRLVAHVTGVVIAVFLVSYAIYTVYRLATRPLFRYISRNWKRHRIYTVE